MDLMGEWAFWQICEFQQGCRGMSWRVYESCWIEAVGQLNAGTCDMIKEDKSN